MARKSDTSAPPIGRCKAELQRQGVSNVTNSGVFKNYLGYTAVRVLEGDKYGEPYRFLCSRPKGTDYIHIKELKIEMGNMANKKRRKNVRYQSETSRMMKDLYVDLSEEGFPISDFDRNYFEVSQFRREDRVVIVTKERGRIKVVLQDRDRDAVRSLDDSHDSGMVYVHDSYEIPEVVDRITGFLRADTSGILWNPKNNPAGTTGLFIAGIIGYTLGKKR